MLLTVQKNLTPRYSATQFTYWAAYSGTTSFATTYLLSKGLSPGAVGVLLASAGLLSCLTQPFLASVADRAKRFLLTKLLIILSGLCGVCFFVQLIPQFPLLPASLFYMLGLWSSDAMIPLLNALSVACNQAGYSINYGVARGIGSGATAIAALVLGYVIAELGTAWMLLLLLALRLACMAVLAGYPKIQKTAPVSQDTAKSCSVPGFISTYRWYCVSLLGILFLGMYHAMTENYLIVIMTALGGDSSHVGTALFISAMAGAPVIFCFGRIRGRISDTSLLKIAAVSFLVKAVLFCFARDIAAIYRLQLLQMTSYAFLAPAQVYYASGKVRKNDMVKGQAFITAAYALGCSAGNLLGGQLLRYGVRAILISGVLMALAGTVILFFTVDRQDNAVDRKYM